MASLLLAGIQKTFGDVRAVADVSLAFDAGILHAVVGENGAGKSTLLRIAAGVVQPDAGEVRVEGRTLRPHNAREASRRGVAMVQQHFALVPALSTLENVMLGAEPAGPFGKLNVAAARAGASAVAHEMGVEIPWDARTGDLSVGDRQRLEIVRALVREARVIILDEPTAVLTQPEVTSLYATLRRLADAGRAVVVVTHRLDEVRDHADWVSVLRRGRLVSSRARDRKVPDDAVMRLVSDEIMGGAALPVINRRKRVLGEAGLVLDRVSVLPRLRDVSLRVRAGEVVGVAGVDGNGQRELVRVIAGLTRLDGGDVKAGRVAVVHADRHVEGLVMDASVGENLVLGELAQFTRFGLVDEAALSREATQRAESSRLPPSHLDAPVRKLSGGNQQKVVVGRAMARSNVSTVLVFAEPTRGVDIASGASIHRDIALAADAGKAVLVVSTDLAELRMLCDRILVMARGRIVGDYAPDTPDARFGEAMLGVTGEAPVETLA